MNKLGQKLDGFFGIEKSGSKISTEIIAGITTFLAMAYILAVNPNMMLNPFGIENFLDDKRALWNSLFIATALGGLIGTLLMSLWAKMPFAQASGMGLNFQVGSMFMGAVGGIAYTLGGIMSIVFIAGVIFLIISVFGLREKVFEGIPLAIRSAIPVGIGLFIAFIGFQNAKLIVANPGTLVSLIDFKAAFGTVEIRPDVMSAIVCFFGLIVITVLQKYKVKGGVLIGVFAATLLGIPLGVTPIGNIKDGWNIVERFKAFFSFNADKGGTFGIFATGFGNAFQSGAVMTTIMLIITFCMIDMFDTIGTLHGVGVQAGMIEEDGKVKNFTKCMHCDAVATVAGAIAGTSTVTTFVESGTGVSVGGRTGLTSLVVACLFFLSIFLSPIFSIIPGAATAPALIYVGVLMLSTVKHIDFSDITMAVPAFLTIVMMPLTYSITNGIGVGLIAYVLISIIVYVTDLIKYNVKKGKASVPTDGDAVPAENVKPKWPVSVVTGIITVLFLVMFIMPTSF